MNFLSMTTLTLVLMFTGESFGRAIKELSDSHQPTHILRVLRSIPKDNGPTHIERGERSIHDTPSGPLTTKIVRAERSPSESTVGGHEHKKTEIVREGRAMDETLEAVSDNQERLERSPAFSPFGRAEGEASAPRRRARSPAFTPFGRAEGEASAPRRRARSPAFTPFGRAEGEASAPRRRARSPVYGPWKDAPRKRI